MHFMTMPLAGNNQENTYAYLRLKQVSHLGQGSWVISGEQMCAVKLFIVICKCDLEELHNTQFGTKSVHLPNSSRMV